MHGLIFEDFTIGNFEHISDPYSVFYLESEFLIDTVLPF